MHMHLNLCESYTCLQQVMLEETVWDSSKHYSLYTIKNDKTVVAVLMEVKLTSHKKFQHALGQVRSQFGSFELPSPFSLAAPWVIREVWDRWGKPSPLRSFVGDGYAGRVLPILP